MAQRLCHAPGSEVIDQGQGHVINLTLIPKRPRRIIGYFFSTVLVSTGICMRVERSPLNVH